MVVGKLASFEDLTVWQESQTLAVESYNVCKTFPKEEVFGLTSQLKRSVTSVSANIAEGFGRQTKKDKLNFYTIAYGSLLESKNFYYLSHKLDYINDGELAKLLRQTVVCQKLLNALMKSIRT
ncbi:MAG: four helix bundle protein [Candidatus Saccharibacteria bacterium]|nr:four helix bundle protein [Candidatus Saccharibacteria bacterium]